MAATITPLQAGIKPGTARAGVYNHRPVGEKMTDKRSNLAQALIALLLMTAWLALLIPKLHMREDEMLSFRYTEGSLVDVVRYQATQDNQAPLWYVVFRAWRTWIGDHEFSARFLGLLLTLVTAAIAYRLAQRWFGGLAGVYTALALAGSAYFVTYALEIRPYALTLTMAAASMWAFDRWLRQPTT
ncbi:MAG: glycosyltransferase family 39 protein, partial [Anaerolinea sp.]|nr:glycosyltransferase family 39 protein [Anaerolinea sp.]